MHDRRNMGDGEAMALALEHAEHARSQGGRPFGAVLAWPGGFAAAGDTKETAGDQTGHAVVNAIRKACQMRAGRRIRESVLYCVKEPCLMCAAAAASAGVREIVYGVPDQDGFFTSGAYRGLPEALGLVGKLSPIAENTAAASINGWA